MRQLGAMDALMYFTDSAQAPCTIGALELLDTSTTGQPVTADALVASLRGRLHLAKTFRQRLMTVPLDLGNPYWVDDTAFDLEFHVRPLALPRPGTWRQLMTQVARLHARPMDLTRPPWELYVIEGLDEVDRVPPGGCALFLRIHHAAIDGVTGAEILSVIHDNVATPPAAAPKPWRARRSPSAWELLARAGLDLARSPVAVAQTARRVVPPLGHGLWSALSRQISLPGPTMPRTRFNRSVSAHRSLEARYWPMQDIRRIKKLVAGATVNDVAITVVSGALRRYLLAHDELPPASLVGAIPVSLRRRGSNALASEGNDITTMFLEIASDIEDDVARLDRVVANTQASKKRKEALGAKTLADIGALVPGRLVGLAQRQQHLVTSLMGRQILYNVPITNVPGSPTPQYIAGATVIDAFGFGPVLNGVGLMNIVGSYCGSLSISVTADRAMLPDPQRYGDALDETVAALLAAVDQP